MLTFSLVLQGNFSFTEKYTVKYAGAASMYFVSKNLKKRYNITDERAALYEAAELWVDALNGREFLGSFSASCHLDYYATQLQCRNACRTRIHMHCNGNQCITGYLQ